MMHHAFTNDARFDVASVNTHSITINNACRPDGHNLDVSPVDETKLLPQIPSLFSKDLPPCGPIPQVAYENVNNRLRKRWLQCTVENPANVSIFHICTVVNEDLEAENQRLSTGSERDGKALKPWRRQNVFQYELRWAKYFMREAEMIMKIPSMSTEEWEKQEFVNRMFPIPKGLRIYIKNTANKKSILELWTAWHSIKRGDFNEQVLENSIDSMNATLKDLM
ncbi:hypothetical protein BKA66DRAFT_505094 [Pyrenochaeta sp. MPI-SDFR-AT-0127]|nr:hypothetical protein BKA66DRAFT_505094 [Pyrenochaeta sp. MPI-SDFR-AT-0127]